MEAQLTFGEYMRRLRKEKNWNLQKLSHETGLSYTHLSRVENDSTVPKAETVAKLADALGGELKQMLELADCLPREILDRIMDREQAAGRPALRRAADRRRSGKPATTSIESGALEVAQAAGLTDEEAAGAATAIATFLKLHSQHRRAVSALMGQLHNEEDADED